MNAKCVAFQTAQVVVLHGPRQAAKSTAAQHLAEHGRPATCIALDSATALAAATPRLLATGTRNDAASGSSRI
jgi:hypothetical protein